MTAIQVQVSQVAHNLKFQVPLSLAVQWVAAVPRPGKYLRGHHDGRNPMTEHHMMTLILCLRLARPRRRRLRVSGFLVNLPVKLRPARRPGQLLVPTRSQAPEAAMHFPLRVTSQRAQAPTGISKLEVGSAYICKMCKIWTSTYFAYLHILHILCIILHNCFCIFLHIESTFLHIFTYFYIFYIF